MNEPLISVIIPVYQGERLVNGAIRSVLNQTHRNLEVLVVDDGSTDATRDVLAAQSDPRVRVYHQENAGTAAARNRALAQARGSYIAFLDSDDRWFPEKLATELRVLQRAPEIGVAYSCYYAVDDRGRLSHLPPVKRHSGRSLDVLLDGDDFLMPSVCLFDRRIFDDLGTFCVERYNEDHEFILRACRDYPIFPTRTRLVVYRQSMSGKCRKILADFEGARGEDRAVVNALASVLTTDQVRRLRANTHRSLYFRFLMYGFDAHARRMLREEDLRALGPGKKAYLGWVFAKTGINLLATSRHAVNAFFTLFLQRSWVRHLEASRMEMLYD